MASEDDQRARTPAPATTSLEAQLAAIADRTSSAIVVVDGTATIRHANRVAGWLLGEPATSLVGAPFLAFVHPDDRAAVRDDLDEARRGRHLGNAVEYRVRSGDGTWRTVSAVTSNLVDLGLPGGILVSATDITLQRAHERRLRELALVDPVSGLPNRAALAEHLAAVMRSADPVVVAFVDIDHFKRINDSLGHTVGDEVLRAAAERLRALTTAHVAIAHFGGDTFVAVVAGVEPLRGVALAWEIVARLASPLFVGGNELRLAASVGVALRDRASTPESILRDAATALTHAKATRRGGVQVFTEQLRNEAVERLALETDLRHAIARDDIDVHLQPIVELDSGVVDAHEALARWTRAGATVPPSVFVPAAEESGLITALGDAVLVRAIAALRAGRAARVNVNLSPRQLLDPGLPARVQRVVTANDVAPQRLVFEITESVIIENFDIATRSLHELRDLGCPVGLDDFGTGHSSLGYLRRLPLDFLKLDRALIVGIDVDPQGAQIIEAILGLARTLSLTTIAEGVEREPQAEVLRAIGCEYGQGWLFGRPAPV